MAADVARNGRTEARAALEALDDATLVAQAQAGDDDAMDAVLARYKGLARSKAAGFFLAGGDADDVVQEGMLGLFKAVRTYRPERGVPFSTFAAYGIAAGITDAVRTATRRKQGPLNEAVSLQGMSGGDEDGPEAIDLLDVYIDVTRPDPEQQVLVREATRSLQEFLAASLTSLERDCVRMLMEGRSYKEMARTLGRSPKAVDNALRRARAKFAVRMRAEAGRK